MGGGKETVKTQKSEHEKNVADIQNPREVKFCVIFMPHNTNRVFQPFIT